MQSDLRFTVTYHLTGTESQAREAARLICVEQTIEASESILPEPLRDQIIGRIGAFESTGRETFRATIAYPASLLDDSVAQLLAVMYGMSSLRHGIRVVDFDLPDPLLQRWPGPRFGIAGLRERTGVHDRPLVCAVLKPVGLSPAVLAELAEQFVLGGVDLIKDDQGLVDQPFCRFEERVQRCAEAVANAARERGRPCLYLPHVTGPPEVMYERAAIAHSAAASGLLLCPGLVGFDALRRLSGDATLCLPILSHPSMLGSYFRDESSGLAPWIVFGRLPRLAGADVTLYPSFGRGFPISAEDCRRIREAARASGGGLKPIFPTAAGRMGLSEVGEMKDFYGRDVLFILGSRVQLEEDGVTGACRRFMTAVGAH